MMLLLAALIGLAVAENIRPASFNQDIPRNGRQAELRIISRLSADSSRFISVGGLNASWSSANVNAHVQVGTGPLKTLAIGALSAGDFQVIDAGEGRTVTVRINTTIGGGNNELCSFQVTAGSRTTVVLRQTTTDPSTTISNGVTTCEPGFSGQCTKSTFNFPGTVSVQCGSPVIDHVDSISQQCDDLPVRFYNFQTVSCTNTQFERLDFFVPANTQLLLKTPLVPTNTNSLSFTRSHRFKVSSGSLWGHGEGRFTDVVLVDGGAAPDVKIFNTSFLNIANVAYRVNNTDGGALDNTFTVVITRGSLTAENVVQLHTNVNPSSTTGWFEVPAQSAYTIHVFESGTSERDIFGDTSVTPTGGSTSNNFITSFTGGVLATNEMRIFRIASSSSDGSGIALSAVPLNGNGITFDNTKWTAWNQIVSRSIQLSAPTTTCCGIFPTTQVNHNGAYSLFGTSDSPQFKIHDASTTQTCQNLGAPLGPTVTHIQAFTSPTQCEVQGLFLIGRIAKKNVTNTCQFGLAGGSSCSNEVDTIARVTSTSLSEGIDIITAPVRMCSCADAAPDVCDDVCVADKFEEVLNSVASTRAAVLSVGASSAALSNSIKAQITALSAQVTVIGKSVDKTRKNLDDVADDVEDILKEKKN